MKIKHGVDVKGLKPEILIALQIADGCYVQVGAPMELTSGMRTWGPKSLHRFGYAVDLGLPQNRQAHLAETISKALGASYDVVLEDDHIHIEFDPKE